MRRIEHSRRRQDGAIGFRLRIFDGKTGGAVRVVGLGPAVGLTATALFKAQRNFEQAMRNHRRPEDEQQQRDELAETWHGDCYHAE